jgi:hypothetical protein
MSPQRPTAPRSWRPRRGPAGPFRGTAAVLVAAGHCRDAAVLVSREPGQPRARSAEPGQPSLVRQREPGQPSLVRQREPGQPSLVRQREPGQPRTWSAEPSQPRAWSGSVSLVSRAWSSVSLSGVSPDPGGAPLHRAPLVLTHPAPDARVLATFDRPLQARLDYRATSAHLPGLVDLE